MKRAWRRGLVGFVVFAMVTALIPAAAFAEAFNEYVEDVEQNEEIIEIIDEVEEDFENGVYEDMDDNPAEQNDSITDVKNFLSSIDSVSVSEATEEDVFIGEAIRDVFSGAEKDTERALGGDGKEYVLEKRTEGGKEYSRIYSEDKSSMLVLVQGDGEISTRSYSLNVDSGQYEKQAITLEVLEDSTGGVVVPQAIKWAKRNYAGWDSRYFYQSGTKNVKVSYTAWTTKKVNGKKKKVKVTKTKTEHRTYLKIGCKAKYRIRLDNLASAKMSEVNAYINAVNESRSAEDLALYIGGGTAAVVAAIGVSVAAGIVCPPSFFVSATGGLGSAIAVATNLANAHKWAKTVRVKYDLIKGYGKKL